MTELTLPAGVHRGVVVTASDAGLCYGTNEGVRSRTRPFFSVQFHPEASPGPEDAGFLFDDFLRLVGAMARSGGGANAPLTRS